MKIEVTPNEMMSAGLWENFCGVMGYSVYAVNEGMDGDEHISITIGEAQEIGIPIAETILSYKGE